MESIRSQEWFHGSIPRSLAEQRLDDVSQGTYLFRESETRPGISLSLKVPGKVKHFLCDKKESGLWHVNGKQQEFTSLDELIEFFSLEENPTNRKDKTCLLYPCPLEEEDPYAIIVPAPLDDKCMKEVTEAAEAAMANQLKRSK